MPTIESGFKRIGARVRVMPTDRNPRFDVVRERRGEVFELRLSSRVDVSVLDIDEPDRHLLLLMRDGAIKSRFLCGHDERQWFVAAIPESSPISTVRQAKEALKPDLVLERQAQVKRKLRARRQNPAYVRQGEWFFVPMPDMRVDPMYVRRREPLSRGPGSNTHLAEEAVRWGGVTVYVLRVARLRDRQRLDTYLDEMAWDPATGLTQEQYETLLSEFPEASHWSWQIMRRDPEVYVRGRVSHPEHRTVVLPGWHRVLMNTEPQARARANVVFLD